MNQRTKEILHLLLERQYSSLQRLSEIHEVSERTIRNDISALNDYLQNLQAGYIRLKQKQVFLHLSIDKQILYEDMNKFDVYEYKFSSDERSLICLLILIANRGYVTLSQLSEKLLTSRSTIVNDMKTVRKLATKNNLHVVSRANKGFQLEAREEDIRSFIYSIICQEKFSILEFVIFDEDYQQEIRFPTLQMIVDSARDILGISEKLLHRLSRHLMISSYRNLKGFTINHDVSYKDEVAKKLYSLCQNVNYPYLTKRDFAFACYHVLDKGDKEAIDTELNREALSTQVIAMKFIEAISQELAIDFKDDYIFYENFAAHLLRMVRKKEHKHSTLDISAVVDSNPKIKRVILQYLEIIEKNIGRPATSLEIDYIIIHVYAAMERKKRIGSNLRVAVLTEQKAAEIFFIESKLISNFSFHLDIYSLDDRIRGEYDLIFTTTPLPNQNYISISPLISDEDYILIASHVNRIVQEKAYHDIHLEKDVGIKLYQMIATEIDRPNLNPTDLKLRIKQKLFSYIDDSNMVDANHEKALYEFLTPDRIHLNIKASDWEDSIYQAGRTLIQKGDITEEYLQVMIDNIKERGPYVVISQGFAFPHANLGTYNKTTSMNLIRLKNEIYFNDDEHDILEDITTMPVRYVCILSTVDRKTHLKAIFNLFNLLKDKEFKEKLDSCDTPEKMHEVIEEEEKLLELRR